MKGGVERPLPDGQRGSGDLCEALRDGPPAPWLQGQRLEDQKVERSLRKTSVRNWRHGATSFVLRQETSASHVEVQKDGDGRLLFVRRAGSGPFMIPTRNGGRRRVQFLWAADTFQLTYRILFSYCANNASAEGRLLRACGSDPSRVPPPPPCRAAHLLGARG